MTPCEWAAEHRAAQVVWRDRSERELTQAWMTGLFLNQAMAGKLKPLATLLAQSQPVKPGLQMTDLALLSEHMGIPLRKASPEALDALRRMRES